jgi:RNase P/RNase MRP subunit POP5
MKSALGQKWRYILARIHLSQKIPQSSLRVELMHALAWQIGVEGIEQTQISIVFLDESLGKVIFRVASGHERRIVASLALISRIGEFPARIESLLISGTLSCLQKKASKK